MKKARPQPWDTRGVLHPLGAGLLTHPKPWHKQLKTLRQVIKCPALPWSLPLGNPKSWQVQLLAWSVLMWFFLCHFRGGRGQSSIPNLKLGTMRGAQPVCKEDYQRLYVGMHKIHQSCKDDRGQRAKQGGGSVFSHGFHFPQWKMSFNHRSALDQTIRLTIFRVWVLCMNPCPHLCGESDWKRLSKDICLTKKKDFDIFICNSCCCL